MTCLAPSLQIPRAYSQAERTSPRAERRLARYKALMALPPDAVAMMGADSNCLSFVVTASQMLSVPGRITSVSIRRCGGFGAEDESTDEPRRD